MTCAGENKSGMLESEKSRITKSLTGSHNFVVQSLMGPAGFDNMGNLEYSGRDSHTGRPSPAGRHFSFSNVLGLGDRVSLSIFCCTSVCQYFSKNSIWTTPWCFFVCRCLTTTLTLPDYDVKCTFISARNFRDVSLSQKLD